MTLCKPITEEDLSLYEALPSNAFYRTVASILDSRICSAYMLIPNNFIALDILHDAQTYCTRYTEQEREQFEKHLADCETEEIRRILLGIYANPIDSKLLFTEA